MTTPNSQADSLSLSLSPPPPHLIIPFNRSFNPHGPFPERHLSATNTLSSVLTLSHSHTTRHGGTHLDERVQVPGPRGLGQYRSARRGHFQVGHCPDCPQPGVVILRRVLAGLHVVSQELSLFSSWYVFFSSFSCQNMHNADTNRGKNSGSSAPSITPTSTPTGNYASRSCTLPATMKCQANTPPNAGRPPSVSNPC